MVIPRKAFETFNQLDGLCSGLADLSFMQSNRDIFPQNLADVAAGDDDDDEKNDYQLTSTSSSLESDEKKPICRFSAPTELKHIGLEKHIFTSNATGPAGF